MDTEEIVERLSGGSLTEAAGALAADELRKRGVEPPATPTDNGDIQPPSGGLLGRCWRGQEKLWKAYWLVAVPCVAACRIVWGATSHLPLSLMLIVPAQVLAWVCVWKCARNCSTPVWTYLSRTLVVVAALAVGVMILEVVGSFG